MPDISRISLSELVGLAVDRDLLKYCCIAKDNITLSIERLDVQLEPEEAQTLLRLLLKATGSEVEAPAIFAAPDEEPESAWMAQPAEDAPFYAEEPAAEQDPLAAFSDTAEEMMPGMGDSESSDLYQKRELFRAKAGLKVQPERTPGQVETESMVMSGDGGSYMDESVSDEYLDSVLAFALSMQIIEGYAKDEEARIVTLRTGATTTGLSYWETLEYLTNSMLYELRPKGEE